MMKSPADVHYTFVWGAWLSHDIVDSQLKTGKEK